MAHNTWYVCDFRAMIFDENECFMINLCNLWSDRMENENHAFLIVVVW